VHRNEALFANEGFYLAFARGDLRAMDRLWAVEHDVLCVHPGWPALTGRASILESWQRIFADGDQPKVAFHAQTVLRMGGLLTVICYEQVGNSVMLASNGFVAESGTVRMVSHHAGMCGNPPPLPPGKVPRFDA
jgi:hypothetical protein